MGNYQILCAEAKIEVDCRIRKKAGSNMPKSIFQMMFLLIRTAWILRDVRQDYKSDTNEQMDWLIEWLNGVLCPIGNISAI